MKKWFVIVPVALSVIIALIWIFYPKEAHYELLFLQESRYILYDPKEYIYFEYFTNKENDTIIYDYTYGFLTNEDQSIKFMIDTFDEDVMHTEWFKGQIFYGHRIKCNLPNINDTYQIDALYLNLFTEGKEYNFFVGSLYVEYVDDYEKLIPWNSLEGIKGALPKLSQILIGVIEAVDIDCMYLGDVALEFYYGNHIMVVLVPESTYLLSRCFLKIVIGENVTYIPQFSYFNNYELLASGIYRKYIR